jgi:hypothetical protein
MGVIWKRLRLKSDPQTLTSSWRTCLVGTKETSIGKENTQSEQRVCRARVSIENFVPFLSTIPSSNLTSWQLILDLLTTRREVIKGEMIALTVRVVVEGLKALKVLSKSGSGSGSDNRSKSIPEIEETPQPEGISAYNSGIVEAHSKV